MADVKAGCVRLCRVAGGLTLCDRLRQATPRSGEMEFH